MTIPRRALLAASLARLLGAGDETAWITRLGGSVRRDGSGDVTAINLGSTWIKFWRSFTIPAINRSIFIVILAEIEQA